MWQALIVLSLSSSVLFSFTVKPNRQTSIHNQPVRIRRLIKYRYKTDKLTMIERTRVVNKLFFMAFTVSGRKAESLLCLHAGSYHPSSALSFQTNPNISLFFYLSNYLFTSFYLRLCVAAFACVCVYLFLWFSVYLLVYGLFVSVPASLITLLCLCLFVCLSVFLITCSTHHKTVSVINMDLLREWLTELTDWLNDWLT